jgi:hypothetical protein
LLVAKKREAIIVSSVMASLFVNNEKLFSPNKRYYFSGFQKFFCWICRLPLKKEPDADSCFFHSAQRLKYRNSECGNITNTAV